MLSTQRERIIGCVMMSSDDDHELMMTMMMMMRVSYQLQDSLHRFHRPLGAPPSGWLRGPHHKNEHHHESDHESDHESVHESAHESVHESAHESDHDYAHDYVVLLLGMLGMMKQMLVVLLLAVRVPGLRGRGLASRGRVASRGGGCRCCP